MSHHLGDDPRRAVDPKSDAASRRVGLANQRELKSKSPSAWEGDGQVGDLGSGGSGDRVWRAGDALAWARPDQRAELLERQPF